jgi:hypothetical protein
LKQPELKQPELKQPELKQLPPAWHKTAAAALLQE